MLNRTGELWSPYSSAPAEFKAQSSSLGILAALQHSWAMRDTTHLQQKVSQLLGWWLWPWPSCEWAGAWKAFLGRIARSQVLTGGASATTSMLLPKTANTLTPSLLAEHHCNHLERSASSQAFQIHLFLPVPRSILPSCPRGKSLSMGQR